MHTLIATVLAVGLSVVLAACGGAAEQPVPEVTTATASVAPAPTGPGSSRDNPFPVGATATVGDFELTLGPTTMDATAEILEYQAAKYGGNTDYTMPPEDGSIYVMVPVTATYTGQDVGDAAIDLNYAYVGGQGNVFAALLPVSIPDDLTRVGELYPGASASGNVMQMVPVEQVEGGVWRVEVNSWESQAAPVFFSAK